jgi:3-deoxy-D-manno-octulosonic-acid transferase
VIFYELILLILTLFASIKKPHHFRRLFAPIPQPKKKEVIWIHAVSVGEAKSVQTLFSSLQSAYPDSFFLVTTTTATGLAEARRSLAGADAFAYLPVDLRWIVRRWAKILSPKLFIMVESDFWPNLLAAIKKNGGKTILVNGKLSEKSGRRFLKVRSLSKKLFSHLDLLIMQNEEHAMRFSKLADPARIQIGGNLKLDHKPTPVDTAAWRQKIPFDGPALTLSCTHAPEEEELLSLLPLNRLYLFLAPRHPERFEEVARILEKKNIPFSRWSELEKKRGEGRVLLVDAMGKLPICYALSRLAIVAGSFRPDIGGHNILEPCMYGIPVFFGPHMFGQKELANRVLASNAGLQVTTNTLPAAIKTFFNTPSEEARLSAAAQDLVASCRGASAATFELIERFLEKQHQIHI